MTDKDPELVKVIDDAIESYPTYIKALERVVDFLKEKRGLERFNISGPLEMFLGQWKVEDPSAEAENMARDVLMLQRECALGNTKDLTGTEL